MGLAIHGFHTLTEPPRVSRISLPHLLVHFIAFWPMETLIWGNLKFPHKTVETMGLPVHMIFIHALFKVYYERATNE